MYIVYILITSILVGEASRTPAVQLQRKVDITINEYSIRVI